MIQARGSKLSHEIHKPVTSIWNEEELPQQWKEYIIIHINKKGNKCN
jgi:hypothetical protein